MNEFNAKVIFEKNIEVSSYNFLTIYGEHVNGYFCCITNWQKACEMSTPDDIFYNYNNLVAAGINAVCAKAIAQEIFKSVSELEASGLYRRKTADHKIHEFEQELKQLGFVLINPEKEEV